MTSSLRSWSLGVSNLFKRLSGSKVLEPDDLDGPMESMKNKLITKNVASDIADKVCDSVKVKLVGQKVGTFEQTGTLVNNALREVCIFVAARGVQNGFSPVFCAIRPLFES